MARASYAEMFSRNPLGPGQQAKLKRATFAIVGLGGIGGFALENLVRAGAERFVLFDSDSFEPSNLNRQLLATVKSLGRGKARVAAERVKAINPRASVRIRGKFSGGPDIRGATMLIDGSDNVETRLMAAESARRACMPYVFCSAGGTRGIVSVFRGYSFLKAFGNPKPAGGKPKPVLCPAAAIAGSLAASQAINLVTGKPYARAPSALFFDLSCSNPFWEGKLG